MVWTQVTRGSEDPLIEGTHWDMSKVGKRRWGALERYKRASGGQGLGKGLWLACSRWLHGKWGWGSSPMLWP